MSTDQSVILFNKSWDIYKKVVEANYMHHHLFHGLIGDLIVEKAKQGPIRMLDLGCGDASQLADHLKGITVAQYTGYDLAETALLIAKENLSFLGNSTRLIEGRMEDLIQEEELQYNIVHTSFAIHHLQDQQKADLIRKITKLLLPGGIFVYVDVFRMEEMDRDAYLKQYCDTLDQHWTLLTNDEKLSIKEHLTNHDYPSTVSFIKEQASQFGLQYMFGETRDGIHHFMYFQKA